MLNLKVDIDPRSGFCFGVVKAIQRAEESIRLHEEIYCLGQIVHNDEEVRRLEQAGMKTITHDQMTTLRNSTILIRAHGEPPETYEILRKNGNRIIDATCPIVLRLQDRVRRSHEQGEFVLIFGKHDHPEVTGLLGRLGGQGLVFRNWEELDLSKLPRKVTLYSQTTMGVDDLYAIRDKLEAAGFTVNLKDTVCRQVSGRKMDMQDFSRDHDVIVFVAGTESSNGRLLFAACLEVNPRSHKISRVDEINRSWFNQGESVGICGATSTPQWLMEKARDHVIRL